MDRVLAALRAAAEPTRLRILCLCAKGELTVTELTQILGQSQPRVSRHLKEMCSAGLLERHQEGSWAFFNVAADGAISRLALSLLEQIPENDDALAQDLRRLEAVRALRAEAARAYFRENAEEWDRIRSFHVDDRQVEAALLSLVSGSPDTRLLDIGTGTGRMLQLLSPVVGQAIGVDSSREMLSVARANLAEPDFANCSVRQADMSQLPWPNASFDLVIAHMVLHFTDDPAAAVAEAARVLRPDGRLLIVDFASHDIEELRAKFAHRRLGFRQQEVDIWCSESALSIRSVKALEGDPLTVMIWESRKLPTVDHRPELIGDTVATWARGATL
ncbi:MAG: metalloregulator ArsR/SmtB family transcription factor [Proteobacteria bacterium]|nr:metalloregulator ArsR/SmtB family transcription factor [Pseudomonadota bacterium]